MTTSATWWAICGLLLALGVIALYVGNTPPPPRKAADKSLLAAALDRVPKLGRSSALIASVTAVAGLVVAITTGWIVALFALPVAAVLVPKVLAQPGSNKEIEKLEALEEWTRALSGVLHAQSGLTGALIATLRSTPAPIYDEVELLATRLQAQRPTPEALRAFADDLDDPTGDLIASALILGAEQSGAGLIGTLKPLATSVSKEVSVRRAVEADRGGPRQEARVLTVISVIALTGFLTLTPYGEAYADPLGQGILAIILTTYFGCLWWMYSMTKDKPAPRFLVHHRDDEKIGARS